MPITQRTRLAALRDPVSVLRSLENKHLAMDATEYLSSSRRVSAALRAMSLIELIVISRSKMPVLSQLADNVLFERGANQFAGDSLAHALARSTAEELLARL